jgi:hypothetical protein
MRELMSNSKNRVFSHKFKLRATRRILAGENVAGLR